MSQRDYGTLILVCAAGMLVFALAESLIWQKGTDGITALGVIFVALGIMVRKHGLDAEGDDA